MRCFVSLNISPSHSRSLEVIRNDTLEKGMCKSLLVFHGGKVICVPVALPTSTSANTPAEGNQRFHLRTESLWIPVTKPGRTPMITPTWAFKPYARLCASTRHIIQSLAEIHHIYAYENKKKYSILTMSLSRTMFETFSIK